MNIGVEFSALRGVWAYSSLNLNGRRDMYSFFFFFLFVRDLLRNCACFSKAA